MALLYFSISKSQTYDFTDSIIGNVNGLKSGTDITPYIPNSSTLMKYVRVNFHFMLTTSGGNFNTTSDGVSANSQYTGYYVAREMIETANSQLLMNEQANLPPNNTIPLLTPKYCFVLDGVYFNTDNANYYYGSSGAVSLYAINSNSVINVFVKGFTNSAGSAHANMSSPCYIEFNGLWEAYKTAADGFAGFIWREATALVHEAGHNMSLYHTLLTPSGYCDLNAEDYCSDTPTGQEMISNYGAPQMCCQVNGKSKICCGFVERGTYCSNNIMDYSGLLSLTPQQLGRIHYALSTYMLNYNVCKTITNDLNITAFSDNQSLYSGQNVTIPASSISGTSIVVKSGHIKNIFVSNTLTLNPGFEVQLGGELFVSVQSYCQ